MNQKASLRRSLAVVLTLATGLALASGTDGGGAAETGDAAAYNTGKSVYAAKLACGGCPMAGKSLDSAMARELIAAKGKVTLSPEETQALEVYLKRRFKL